MSAKNGNAAGLYYIPGRLMQRLAMISAHPVTVIEAPPGFGKTTAVREYLNDLSSSSRERWYTCLGEPPLKAWGGICRLFGEVNESVDRRLRELYPPTMENLADIAALMREFNNNACCDGVHRNSERETFLVIDNYQLFENEIPNDLINAFSAHGNEKLHIVVITQPLPFRQKSAHIWDIHRLSAKDFCFDRESIVRFCRRAGIRLSEEELDFVDRQCCGWISAIRLQADNYRETGTFVQSSDTDDIIETALLSRLTNEDHNFLMALSLLDGFTVNQASVMDAEYMGKQSALSEGKIRLLEKNYFIPYIDDKRVYSMHIILRNCLQKRFERQNADFITEVNHKAGEACLVVSDYFEAARFFLAAKDYDAVLSIPFTPLYMSEVKERNILGLMEQVIAECGEEALLKYPLVIIRSAFQFIQHGKKSEFEKMMLLLKKFLDNPPVMPPDELLQVKGEVATLMSFSAYNDIERMSRCHREALSCLSEKNSASRTIIFGTTPWTFGITSVLYMFWSKSGELENELAAMDECLPYYLLLAGGHGSGAEDAFRAEANLMRGDDTTAESFCNKATYSARIAGQHSICICASLILGRIAVLRGDEKMLSQVLKDIEKDGRSERALRRMAELCKASIVLDTGEMDDLVMPDWLRDKEAIRKILHVQGHSYGFMLYGKFLLRKKLHSELYALTGMVMGLARGMNYLLPQIYHQINLAVAKEREKKRSEAMTHLAEALNIALPDRVYLPFAESGTELRPLLEAVMQDCEEPEKIASIIALGERFSSGASKITAQMAAKRLGQTKSILTPREREIALLAKEGLKPVEIASRFTLTEGTVRYVLKQIYAKLEVHSRTELMIKDF